MPIADALRSAELSWFASQVWKLQLGAIDAKLADTALQMASSPRKGFVPPQFLFGPLAWSVAQAPNSSYIDSLVAGCRTYCVRSFIWFNSVALVCGMPHECAIRPRMLG